MTTDTKCIFCRIVAGKSPASIVADWPDALAVVPLGPVTDGHVLVIPKDHVDDFTSAPGITAMVCARAAEFAARHGGDMNMITSKGATATQTDFHLHVHLVPREAGDGLPLPWTPQQERERARQQARRRAHVDHDAPLETATVCPECDAED
jgi:histidine triad (HIT) family protein